MVPKIIFRILSYPAVNVLYPIGEPRNTLKSARYRIQHDVFRITQAISPTAEGHQFSAISKLSIRKPFQPYGNLCNANSRLQQISENEY